MSDIQKSGKVYIVGAGPGDCGLLTCIGFERLKEADVVVYDRLINYELLSCCKDECEKIFVGKESGHHLIEQELITSILLEKSKAGLNVVRLKGGNPFIFGRGSEEAIEIKKAGIDYEIIPGVTSGLAAPIYSGIPVTHRGMVTQCVFITAHECPDKPGSQVEWEKLARLKNTSLIIYMGASRIEDICLKLIKSGMDPGMPAAAIENGTLPKQRTLTASLQNLSEEFGKQKFHAPVIIMISPAIILRDKISWFENKKLFNKRIIISSEASENHKLKMKLNELGADVIILPHLYNTTKYPEPLIKDLFLKNKFKWILFSGTNEVESFFELMRREKADIRIFADKSIAVTGRNTKEALERNGFFPDYYQPESCLYPSENLIKNFHLNGYNLLWIKSEQQKDVIKTDLKYVSDKIKTLEVCKLHSSKPESIMIEDIKTNGGDVFVFPSLASLNNFVNLFGTKTSAKILNHSRIIAQDSTTARFLSDKYTSEILVAEDKTDDTIFSTICQLFNIEGN